MKIDFIFTLPTAHNDYDSLRWYDRDAKRIKKRIAWSSGVYKKTQDDKYIIEIMNKNKPSDIWIVDMVRDRTTGRTKVTPIGRAYKLIPYIGNYFLYKLVP